jgi:4-hydroxy-2-oxoglutarate aldolase
MLLEGLQLPLTTPFYSDGRLNLHKLDGNVGRYSKTPIAGMVVLSEHGEPTMLSDEETRLVLRGAIGAAAPEKVMMAGVSRDGVAGTLDLADAAAEFGYDAVLVKRPSILRGDGRGDRTRELLTYFQMVADRSALPVVLYSGAEEQGGLLAVEVVAELAGHPKIIGLVDAAGSQERIGAIKEATAAIRRDVTVTTVFAAVTGRMQGRNDGEQDGGLISAQTLTDRGAVAAVAQQRTVIKTRTKAVGFQVLAGSTAGMLEGLIAGVVGAMPAFAASAPQACYEVLAAWKDGDAGLAEEKQIRLGDAAARVEIRLGVGGIKFGCDLNGYFGGSPRLPRLPLTGDERAEIEALMQGVRN